LPSAKAIALTARRPTIADVALRAGVSKGAVSFALNGRPGVSPATRQRILGAADELGWRPNLRARALPARRAYAIGLVVARPARLLASDPFFAAFIAGVELELAERDLALVLQVAADASAETAGYRRLAADGRVDGVLLTDVRAEDQRIPLLRSLGLPAVTLGRPDLDSPFPAVIEDDAAGVHEAVRHLVDLGHTRIGHVAGPDHFIHGSRRRESWRAAVESHGLTPGPLRRTDFSPASGARATAALLRSASPPTAIVYASDLLAIAGIGAAHRLGLTVPRDLSVTGFDDTLMAAHITPALTTVHVDAVAWGRAATVTLLRLVTDGSADDLPMPAPGLVVRDSTAPPTRPRTSDRDANPRVRGRSERGAHQ
jgi:DNA-binding LacI/PurR family transcriptional regulator